MPAPTRRRPAPAPRADAPLPLSHLLIHTADAVRAVSGGRSLTDALAACPTPARPGTQALSFAVMRRLGLARALVAYLVPKRPAPWVEALLVSATALACGDEYPAHTLVDQAVQAARRKAGPASGLVNAVLRRLLREGPALREAVATSPEARWNHPAWWVERLQRDWPTEAERLLEGNQHAGPMFLRVNARQHTRAAYQALLSDAGLASHAVGDGMALVLERAAPVHLLPGFDTGAVSVQDLSAQQAAELLLQAGLRAGARVLDACSAPGGKTAHLLEAQDLDLLALDVDADRLARVDDTLARLRLSAHTQVADAARPDTWWDGRPFEAVVLDAPCSASGIVRRHPDVRWLRRPGDIEALARTQDALLDALWPLVAPGGLLLYCTCSVFRAEGEDRIAAFLQRQPGALRLPAPGHLLPVIEYPDTAAVGDGFYYALLRKPGPIPT